jgi:hypothetical protein
MELEMKIQLGNLSLLTMVVEALTLPVALLPPFLRALGGQGFQVKASPFLFNGPK